MTHEEPILRDGRLTLDFEDAEGQRLMLVDDGGAGDAHPWPAGPVPVERQIRGLGPIRLSLARIGATEAVLAEVLGMSHARSYDMPEGEVRVWQMGEGARGPSSTSWKNPACRPRGRERGRSTTSPSASPMRITAVGPTG